MALIKEVCFERADQWVESTLRLAGRKVQRGPIGVYTSYTQSVEAQERDRGPVLTLLWPAMRSMRATDYAAAPAIHGHQLPLPCPACWEMTLVGWCTDIVGQMGTQQSDPGLA